jgi:hypothetical protein
MRFVKGILAQAFSSSLRPSTTFMNESSELGLDLKFALAASSGKVRP